MINLETWHKSCLAALLAGILLIGTSCGSEAAEEGVSRTVQVKAAEPSTGVGRDMETEEVRTPGEPKDYTICIDPGHGFVDGGTGEGLFENGILEKDINLMIANLLAEDLEFLGYNTIMTHNGVDLPAADTDGNQVFNVRERSAYVNTLDIDYLVSIHVNAIEDTTVNGSQIYCEQNANKVNTWSQPIAEEIAESLSIAFPDSKEMRIWANEKDKTLEMTRETKAAASLIEIGFCTNETDRNNMIDPEWQATFSQAVADGINQFFVGLEK